MANARDGVMAEQTRAIPLRARLPTSRRQSGDFWTFLVAAAKRDSDTGAALREALCQLEPEVVKKLLLRHTRGCTNPKCTTCDKLRTRIDKVKRKGALWRLFRIVAKVAGVLSVKLARAAERAYAPGAAGYQEVELRFKENAKSEIHRKFLLRNTTERQGNTTSFLRSAFVQSFGQMAKTK